MKKSSLLIFIFLFSYKIYSQVLLGAVYSSPILIKSDTHYPGVGFSIGSIWEANERWLLPYLVEAITQSPQMSWPVNGYNFTHLTVFKTKGKPTNISESYSFFDTTKNVLKEKPKDAWAIVLSYGVYPKLTDSYALGLTINLGYNYLLFPGLEFQNLFFINKFIILSQSFNFNVTFGKDVRFKDEPGKLGMFVFQANICLYILLGNAN